MKMCEVKDRIPEWPYLKRCGTTANRRIQVRESHTPGDIQWYDVCDAHRSRARQADNLLADLPIPKEG